MKKEKIVRLKAFKKGNYRFLKVNNNSSYVLSRYWYRYDDVISLLEEKFIIDEESKEKIKRLF